jgi:hypothetical protein
MSSVLAQMRPFHKRSVGEPQNSQPIAGRSINAPAALSCVANIDRSCILPDRRSTPILDASYYDGTRISFFFHQFEI